MERQPVAWGEFCLKCWLTLSQQKFKNSKLKDFANDKFDVHENGGKDLQMGRKHCGTRRNYLLQEISPFYTVFSRDIMCRHIKTRERFKEISGKLQQITLANCA